MKAADYGTQTNSAAAFVSTNSICQGQQVSFFWPLLFATGHEISFAYTSFKWANLASQNAGVTVVIVGISNHAGRIRKLFTDADDGKAILKEAENINAYLVPTRNIIVQKAMEPLTELSLMDFGNKADDGGYLTLSASEVKELHLSSSERKQFIRRFWGSSEFINSESRFCLWIEDDKREKAERIPSIARRIESVRKARLRSPDAYANKLARRPHQFKTPRRPLRSVIVTPRVSSEDRQYLPVGLLDHNSIIGDRNFALYDAPLWNLAIIASRLHWVWIGTVCVRLEMRFSYSNTLGWNTFPVPKLTNENKAELTRCAENILLAREVHFPASIAELYDPETMPENLRRAHEQNDETLERIYIGRRFKNDTERLEKLFDMYTKMTAAVPEISKKRKAKA
jgi:hypothetical protein